LKPEASLAEELRPSNTNRISVLIVEDQEIMRFSLKKALEKFENLAVLGEAANGLDAVDKARSLKPLVVIMDIGLPELNGIDATRIIKSELPETRVVMLTSFDDEQRTFASLAAGADAYCCKSIQTPELVSVIQKVFDGCGWLDSTVARHVVKVYETAEANENEESVEISAVEDVEDDGALSILSSRELQILKSIMHGQDEDEIAMRMAVNVDSVRTSVRKILNKLAGDERTHSYLAYLQPGMA
jgi:DNA-binding NarL/FixJ family response regulator